MGYKEDLLRQINELKAYTKLFNENRDEATTFQNQLRIKEIAYQAKHFFLFVHNRGDELFGSEEAYRDFLARHQDLLAGENRLPLIRYGAEDGKIEVPNVDFERLLNVLEEECPNGAQALEDTFQSASAKLRENNHPLQGRIEEIKQEVDSLFEGDAALGIKASLDFANEEIVEKIGENIVDDAIDVNSNQPDFKIVAGLSDFVKSKGLDEKVYINQSKSKVGLSIGMLNKDGGEKNIGLYRPFLKMETNFSEEYKAKFKGLNALIEQEGLMKEANGGEMGRKEYSLGDYFTKLYALKKAVTDQSKMVSAEEKRNNLIKIDNLAKQTKDITARYGRVLGYIKDNFDMDHISLPGNLYGGRPNKVGGNVESWYPNLPPKFDFENSAEVGVLNGFSQLKAACQVGGLTVEEFVDDPVNAYLRGAENVAAKCAQNVYLPRSPENPLGKRLARILVTSGNPFDMANSYAMAGGRAMGYLTNTNPDKDVLINNGVITGFAKDYGLLADRNPHKLFGSPEEPQIDNIKRLFAFGDSVDDLSKVSSNRYSVYGEKSPTSELYEATLHTKAKVAPGEEYRKIMEAIKGYHEERRYMYQHKDLFEKPDKLGVPNALEAHSLGTLLAAGREYFIDYLKENNLSIASIEDPKLREEVTNFLTNPLTALSPKYIKEKDYGPDKKQNIVRALHAAGAKNREEARSFFQAFNVHNQKPNGYNVGKTFPTIVSDNKGGFWERLRGLTSKEYTVLQKVAKAVSDPNNPCFGDKKALYVAAKAYREYKLPEGVEFASLSKTAKKRVEFCDAIIDAYEEEMRKKAIEEMPQPVIVDNNIPVNQDDFQAQLGNDIDPHYAQPKEGVSKEKANEKDPPDEGVEP